MEIFLRYLCEVCVFIIVYNILLFIRLEFPYNFKWDFVDNNKKQQTM